ncbi:Ku protein [Caulobacter sp. Root1472]|uniref:non-homologous end joining protein Ku n=1 Tax=Caulobacter sp. Root1472 TaxID=1736470 RepID=UPI0006F84D9D|nr:Ku protein [Caulobacter sp. Root1472]KQZ30004.1 Ku protein [Caulobacter sp. Root1472]
MAARPSWQGHLRLSLVTCPVAMYTATSPGGEVRFNLLHPKTHNRIKMIATDPDLGPVNRSDLVKGYEYEKDHYVILTPEEIESVRLESTRTIDIERFVDAADIDRLYWDNPYFLVPDGKLALDAYTVIRDAMAGAGKIALGRVVMHTRERLLAIEPRDNGLICYTLRSHDEVRDSAELFDDIPDRKADPQMVAIAEKIIEQQEGPFDPSQFKDRYEDALRALIKQKEKGGKAKVTVEEPDNTNVVDLMEALRKSLGQKPGAAPSTGRSTAKPKKAAAKAPTKRAAPRKKAS